MKGVPGNKDSAVQRLFYKPVACPDLIEHNPPEAINIDKRFKRHVVRKGLLSLESSQADTSHMVISLLVLPYGEDISCITSKWIEEILWGKGRSQDITQTQGPVSQKTSYLAFSTSWKKLVTHTAGLQGLTEICLPHQPLLIKYICH